MISRTPVSRREVLAWLGAAGLVGVRPGAFARLAPITKWGIQLYTLRSLAQKDFEGTLKAVGEIGYKEVETAGYFGRSAADVRKALDAAGVTSPSMHLQVGLSTLNDSLASILQDCATIGHKWIVVPSLPGNLRTPDGYKQAGEMLAKAAMGAKSSGIRVAYHNHDVDFRAVGDSNGMELLLASAGKDVFAELDVYWIVKAGGDPFDFIAKHPGRVKMLHLKDASPAPEMAMREVGSGTIAWPKLLGAADKAGVEHAFVEHDNPGDAIASARTSFGYLSKMPRNGRG